MISPSYHINFAGANIGAKVFLLSLENYAKQEPELAQTIWERVVNLQIKGSRLWILFSDIAKEDFEKLYKMLTRIPGEVIVKASENISGRFIINQYLNESEI